MADELIDIYDENDVSLGIIKLRSEAARDGSWHRAALVFLFDSDGNILLQKRSKNKDINPNRWYTSASGHIGTGESPRYSALRETEEEIGIRLQDSDLGDPLIFSSNVHYPNGNRKAQFKYIFFVKKHIDPDTLILQVSEVSEARLFSIGELEHILHHEPDTLAFLGDGFWEFILSEIRMRLDGSK